MTFLGEENEVWETVVFSVILVVLLVDLGVCVCFAHKVYASGMGALIAGLMLFENGVLVAGDAVGGAGVLAGFVKVLHAFTVPLLMVFFFELAYNLHKRRSVKFCGITFDEGHRKSYSIQSYIVRHSTQVVAALLVAINIVVNFDLLEEDDDEAGRAGYTSLGGNDGNPEHLVWSLVPSIILAAYVMYLSLALWRYGSESSLTVYASKANPWVVTLLGGVAQIVGQVFDAEVYAVTSNAGEAVLLTSIVILIPHIVSDLDSMETFAAYLHEAEETKRAEGFRRDAAISQEAPSHESQDKLMGHDGSAEGSPGPGQDRA